MQFWVRFFGSPARMRGIYSEVCFRLWMHVLHVVACVPYDSFMVLYVVVTYVGVTDCDCTICKNHMYNDMVPRVYIWGHLVPSVPGTGCIFSKTAVH